MASCREQDQPMSCCQSVLAQGSEVVVNCYLRAYYELEPCFFGGKVSLRSTVDSVDVGYRQGAITQAMGSVDQGFW